MHLNGGIYRIHAVTIANSPETCYELFQDHLKEFQLQLEGRDLVNVIGGYIGEGYGKCTEDDLRKCNNG